MTDADTLVAEGLLDETAAKSPAFAHVVVPAAMPPAVAPGMRLLQAGDLPTIDADRAAAARLVHDLRLADWLADTFGIRLAKQTGRVSADCLLLLTLAAPGGDLLLAVPADLLPALSVAAVDVVRSLAALLPLMATRMLAPLIERIAVASEGLSDRDWQALSVTAVRLHAPAVHGAVPAPLTQWEWSLPGQFSARAAVLSIDPGCVAVLQQMILRYPVRPAPMSHAWRIGTLLRIATRPLRSDLLRTLRTGDVVLCGEHVDINQVNARLYCGAAAGVHWSAAVQISQQKVSLMSQLQSHDGNADSDLDFPGPALASHVAELEVPVHFEIDNAALSLAQLSALRPGYVIELSIPVKDAEIRLVSCGQVIGRGRLVVIGDCLGVQIDRIAGGAA